MQPPSAFPAYSGQEVYILVVPQLPYHGDISAQFGRPGAEQEQSTEPGLAPPWVSCPLGPQPPSVTLVTLQ